MRIYTKTGDQGQTGLWGGGRVFKDDPRIIAYGTVDELNGVLGMARAALTSECLADARLEPVLHRIQQELFLMGAQLASANTSPPAHSPGLSEAHVQQLEADIDYWEERLPPLKNFILPAGNGSAATIHLARTVCRRAERAVVALTHGPAAGPSPENLIVYLNRLSDLLFVLARAANWCAGRPDEIWTAAPPSPPLPL